MVKIFRLSLIASVAILAGCGGGDDEDISFRPTPSTPTPMLAMDGFATVTPNKESFIDLSPFVRGTEVSISSIKVDSDNEQCGKPTLSGTGVKVDITAGTFCQYTYTAAQTGSGQAQAALNVLATSAVQATLPPLSEALVVGTASTSFNVQTLLTNIGAWKSTYRLDTSSVTVHGIEGNVGSVDNIAGNSFNFTPPDLPGWNRIVFTLIDSNAPSAPVMGVLYVTVSQEVNQPPSISEPKYDYNANNPSASVVVGERVTLNLASLPGLSITEPDSQEWQLVKALSWAATVDATEPNSVTNKSIDFTASSMGDHYVTYIVADHYGGYASGLIKITVGVRNDPSTWNDIETGGKTFLAPDTYAQATNKGFLTTPEWDNGVSNTVAGYTSTSGQTYCNTVGTLPTTAEMGALYTGPAAELALWPKDKPYLATEGVNYRSYNLHNGVLSNYDAATAHYVTCVQAPTMTLELLLTDVIADGEVHALAQVTMPNESDEFYITKAGGTLDERDVNIEKGSKSGKVTTLTTSSTTAGTYSFTVTNANDISEQLTSGEILYKPDSATLSVNVQAARGYPNGITATPITITLTDANNNHWTHTEVGISSSNDNDRFTPNPINVDMEGKYTAFATYGLGEGTRTVTIAVPNDVPPTGADTMVNVTPRLASADRLEGPEYELSFERTEGLDDEAAYDDIRQTVQVQVNAYQHQMSALNPQWVNGYVTSGQRIMSLGNYGSGNACRLAGLAADVDSRHYTWIAWVDTPAMEQKFSSALYDIMTKNHCILTSAIVGTATQQESQATWRASRIQTNTVTASSNSLTLEDLETCSEMPLQITYETDRITIAGSMVTTCDGLQKQNGWNINGTISELDMNLTNNLGLTLGVLPAEYK